jgi:hypothetical protein
MNNFVHALSGPWPVRVLVILSLLLIVGGIGSAVVTLSLAARERRAGVEQDSGGDLAARRRHLCVAVFGGMFFVAGVVLLIAGLLLAVWFQNLRRPSQGNALDLAGHMVSKGSGQDGSGEMAECLQKSHRQ